MVHYTDEQSYGIERAIHGSNLAFQAAPGSGKSTLARGIANNLHSVKGGYFVFNESAAREAQGKYPNNFNVSTSNALAFKQMAQLLQGRKIKNLNAYEVSEILDIKPSAFASPSTYGYYINQTLFNFCNSADGSINLEHVPDFVNENDDLTLRTKSEVAHHAADLMRKICKRDSPLPIGHNIYMKMWQLGNPDLKLDTIILDEGQDVNPVWWDVITKQKNSQIIILGDPYQQINAWRGGMNVMSMLHDAEQLKLTKSFRFGPDGAALANCILVNHFASSFQVYGNPAIKTDIGRIQNMKNNLHLYRTNAGMIADVMKSLERGESPWINGGVKEMKTLILQCANLKKGRRPSTGDFKNLKSWDEAKEFSKTPAGFHLGKIIQLVSKHDVSKLIKGLDSIPEKKPSGTDVVFSTVHKAKGMQAASVKMGGDFISPDSKRWTEAESNLLYVGVTRAQRHIDEFNVREMIKTVSSKFEKKKEARLGNKDLIDVKVDIPESQGSNVIQEISFGEMLQKPGPF